MLILGGSKFTPTYCKLYSTIFHLRKKFIVKTYSGTKIAHNFTNHMSAYKYAVYILGRVE